MASNDEANQTHDPRQTQTQTSTETNRRVLEFFFFCVKMWGGAFFVGVKWLQKKWAFSCGQCLVCEKICISWHIKHWLNGFLDP